MFLFIKGYKTVTKEDEENRNKYDENEKRCINYEEDYNLQK